MERDLIVERTKAGLESARARGRKGGTLKADNKKVEKAIKLYNSKQYTVKEIEEMTGVSKATLYRSIRQENQESRLS
ncbi:helix-turn-helix domain-containing protein [Bacillus sp. ISL-46]|uniref:helix-turn-helix domain-containing protein n=1 Tax=Bacillus sp. ISL-46 TaxID=2819129 RepID=UPI001BEBDE7D|nr:recombinase family protein [Bacillus sp. ISL-46]